MSYYFYKTVFARPTYLRQLEWFMIKDKLIKIVNKAKRSFKYFGNVILLMNFQYFFYVLCNFQYIMLS